VELNEEESLLVIKRLHKVLRPFMLRRLKKDVESELPDKVEKIIKCSMSALQRRVYKQIKTGTLVSRGRDASKLTTKGLANTLMHLRKVCNHPYVFREVEDQMNPNLAINLNLLRAAGKFELLDVSARRCSWISRFPPAPPPPPLSLSLSPSANLAQVQGRWTQSTYFLPNDRGDEHL